MLRSGSTLLLSALLTASTAFAGQFPDPGQVVSLGFTGAADDYVIPTTNSPVSVKLTVKGGNGGNANPFGNHCESSGGRGALLTGVFTVGTGVNELAPGGTLRYIVGDRGQDCVDDESWTAGGGGGGTGVLYLAPGTTEWAPLLVAGGGGGAAQCVDFWICWGADPGADASLTECGTTGGGDYPGSGGCNGQGGVPSGVEHFSSEDFIGGTAGGGLYGQYWYEVNPGLNACGNLGAPAGGAGGWLGAHGGWGCGGGGAGWSSCCDRGAGGGGGYSGGGGGSNHSARPYRGGGGGSFAASFANLVEKHVYDGDTREGFAKLEASGNNDLCTTPTVLPDLAQQSYLVSVDGLTDDNLLTPALPRSSCDTFDQTYAAWYSYTNTFHCTRRIVVDAWAVQMQLSTWSDCQTSTGCWVVDVLNSIDQFPITIDVAQGETVLFRMTTNMAEIPGAYYSADFTFSFIGNDPDGDGVSDCADNCALYNPDQLDTDGDGVGDTCDACAGGDDKLDADGDGVPDDCDRCPGTDDTLDADLDGVPDGCDVCLGDDSLDVDGDGIPDACDPGSSPTATEDCDGNLIADEYELSTAGAIDERTRRFEDFSGRGAQAYTLNGQVGVLESPLRTLVLNNGATNLAGSAIFEPLSPGTSLGFGAGFWFRMDQISAGGGGFSFSALDADVWDASSTFGPTGPAGDALTVSFDTYQDPGDPNDNHIEVLFGGQSVAIATPGFELDDGAWRFVSVQWFDGALFVDVKDALGNDVLNLGPLWPNVLGRRWRFGFGSQSDTAGCIVQLDQVMLEAFTFGFGVDMNADGQLDACQAGQQTVRLGVPANPPALKPDANGPALGVLYQPYVDHSSFLPNASFDTWLISQEQENVRAFDWGVSLLRRARVLKVVSPGVSPSLPIPAAREYMGLRFSLQVLSTEGTGATPTRLYTNALDVVVGGWGSN